MKNKQINTMRKKILKLLLLSFVLSKAVTLLLLGLVVLIMGISSSIGPFAILTAPVQAVVYLFYNTIGVLPTLYLVDLVLFFVLFLLLTSKQVTYLAKIMDTVKEMSKGNFAVSLPIATKNQRPKDELAVLAVDINQMGERLEAAIEEELKAVQGKNELITNVSHDLRTPLTSIIGYLRLIDEDRYKDEVDLRYYVNIAYDKSKRLERMVNDLFEYTRVNYGGLVLHRTEINLVQLLAQLSAQFSLQLEEQDMDMQLSFSQETIQVLADGDKIMRVFENLIANAIKYGHEGKRVEIRGRIEDNEAVVQVINYGARIPSADIPQLFNRFYRVDKSRSDATGGSGLGLAIAKSIVELHKGAISVTSDEFETNFEVRLPLIEDKTKLMKSKPEIIVTSQS